MIALMRDDLVFNWMAGEIGRKNFGKTCQWNGMTFKLTKYRQKRHTYHTMYRFNLADFSNPDLLTRGDSEEEAIQLFKQLWNRRYMDNLVHAVQLARPGTKVRSLLTNQVYTIAAVGHLERLDVVIDHTFGSNVESLTFATGTSVTREKLKNFVIADPYQHLTGKEQMYCETCCQIGTLDSLAFRFVRSLGFICGPCHDYYEDNGIDFVTSRSYLR